MMAVGPNAAVHQSMVKIYDNSFIAEFARITQSVHELGGKLVVQLGHCGAKSTVIDWGDKPFSPSIYGNAGEITKDEIQMLVKKYGEAAVRCKEAGADGVQIHAAHGYLVSEFLSPYFNKRSDEYGGDIKGRAKFLLEIYHEIRSSVGENYPILMKINYCDLVENGLVGNECEWVCRQLEKQGLNAIEVSSGIGVSPESAPTQPLQKGREGFFVDGALKIAEQVAIPVISVGGCRSLDAIDRMLNKGKICAVSLSRPFIKEPFLAQRWRNGDRTKSSCVSCNGCISTAQHGCIVNQSFS